MPKLMLQLCSDCLGKDAKSARELIGKALGELRIADQVELRFGPCLEQCEKPVAVSLQMEGGASYVFSDLSLEQDAQDIAATCKAYLDSPKGWIGDARPCGRLRFCLVARVPA